MSPPFDWSSLGKGNLRPQPGSSLGWAVAPPLTLEAPWTEIMSPMSAWASLTGLFHQTGTFLKAGLSPPLSRELPRQGFLFPIRLDSLVGRTVCLPSAWVAGSRVL